MESADCDQYIGLNVGGKIFRTSRATLTRYPDSFFAAMLDGGIPSAKDEQGNYLIDRDGKIFCHVLNFLRSGELVLPDRFNKFNLLEREADFFSLEELKRVIYRTETIGVVDESSSTVYKMSRLSLMREEDSYFAKIVRGQINPLKDSHGNFLIDSRGSKGEFKQIMQYLKYGIILSPLKYSSSSTENTLYKMADRFGLQLLKDQVQLSMNNQYLSVTLYYWQNGPECCLYFNNYDLPSLSQICQEYAHIFSHPLCSFKVYAGFYFVTPNLFGIMYGLHTCHRSEIPHIQSLRDFVHMQNSILAPQYKGPTQSHIHQCTFCGRLETTRLAFSLSSTIVYASTSSPASSPDEMTDLDKELEQLLQPCSPLADAGLIDLRKILQDACVTPASVETYFNQKLNKRVHQTQTLSPDCIKLIPS